MRQPATAALEKLDAPYTDGAPGKPIHRWFNWRTGPRHGHVRRVCSNCAFADLMETMLWAPAEMSMRTSNLAIGTVAAKSYDQFAGLHRGSILPTFDARQPQSTSARTIGTQQTRDRRTRCPAPLGDRPGTEVCLYVTDCSRCGRLRTGPVPYSCLKANGASPQPDEACCWSP